MYYIRYFGILSLCCINILGITVNANELSQIQKNISQQQAKIEEQKKKRALLHSTLKSQEIQIGQVNIELKKIEFNLEHLNQSIKQTEQEIKRLEIQENEQKKHLEEQLDTAYRLGLNPSLLERLISDSMRDIDRIGSYYEHINQVRVDLIQQLRRTQQNLKIKRDQLKNQQAGQQRQLAEQKKQEKELMQIKYQRENTIQALDKMLEKEQNHLELLKSNEIALRRKIALAIKEAEEKEKREIAQLEQKKNNEEKHKVTEQEKQQNQVRGGLSGKYAMPVKGKILNHFGSPQIGELKWNGIVIEATSGTAVNAIAAGRVILASWLEGYGQLVALDHGNGDMSFYGYNQSVSVEQGSLVKAGQTIAYVGNSGGQNRAALYFAIRRKGVAVNPLNWVK